MKKQKKSNEERINLLKCFANSRHKCKYLCTTNDENIDAIGDLLYDFIHNNIKIRNVRKVLKTLHPVRKMIRVLADRKVKTRKKRKLLLEFGIRILLLPFIQKRLIPCMLTKLTK